MNYSYQQLGRLSRSLSAATCGVRATRLWNRYLRVVAAIAGLIGNTLLTVIYFVLLPPFAWAARRAERRETPGWRRSRPTARNRRPACTDMKILGISAHYHDAAAALVVDGVPVLPCRRSGCRGGRTTRAFR